MDMNWTYDNVKKCYVFQEGGSIPKFQNSGTIQYTPSEEVVDSIKKFEGWHQGWKDDGKGNLTTGWGFKQTPELKRQFPKGMTRAQADKYLTTVAIPQRVNQIVRTPNWDIMTDGMRDALFDAFYNVGEAGYFNKSPKLQQALQDKNWEEAINQMDWDYNDPSVPGARKRRDWERQLFRQSLPKPVVKPAPEPIQQTKPEKRRWQIMMEPMINDPIFYSK